MHVKNVLYLNEASYIHEMRPAIVQILFVSKKVIFNEENSQKRIAPLLKKLKHIGSAILRFS